MPIKLNIFQHSFKVGRHTNLKREVLEIETLLNPHIDHLRKFEGRNVWEWRAKTDLGCARIEIFGFSETLNQVPGTWYTVKDNDPINLHVTESEMREAAIMAVRGECYQISKHPETVPPVEALVILVRMITNEPDLLFAKWFEKAINGDEIYYFLREWEKSFNKKFLPKPMPRFAA